MPNAIKSQDDHFLDLPQVSLCQEGASWPVRDAADHAGVGATRLGMIRRMTRKAQERYIAELLDQWENRLDSDMEVGPNQERGV